VSQPDHGIRENVEAAIREAFAGVRLGDGVSIQRLEDIDSFGEKLSPTALNALLRSDVTDDWTAVPASDLDNDYLAHLDAEGMRYYIPALMLWLLDAYDAGEMATIGVIGVLDQRHPHPPGFLELLSSPQRCAIAHYVQALPQLVELDYEDARRIDRALRDVWSGDLAHDQ
jgi:hypothetical protein